MISKRLPLVMNVQLHCPPKMPSPTAISAKLGLHLFDWGKARANLITAQSMGANVASSFHRDYESVSDFEEKYSVEVPSDIAELLTG